MRQLVIGARLVCAAAHIGAGGRRGVGAGRRGKGASDSGEVAVDGGPLVRAPVCSAGDEAAAATSGVDGPAEVAKYLLAGADVVMTASALLGNGPEYAALLLDGLSAWMVRKGFAAIDELPAY